MAKAQTNTAIAETTFEMIPQDQIKPYNEQPRTYIDPQEVEELADSIDQAGQNTAIVVTQRPNEDFYVLIGGERRWRACGVLSKRSGEVFSMKAVIEPYVDEAGLFSQAFTDNTHRKNMPPLDVAAGFARLLKDGRTIEDISRLSGYTTPYANSYLLLNDLDHRVKALMDPRLGKGKSLGVTHAITLTKVPNAEMQFALAQEAIAARMSDGDLNIAMVQQAEERGVNLNRPANIPNRTANSQYKLLETFLRNTERWLNRETDRLNVGAMYEKQAERQVEIDTEQMNRILTGMRKLKARMGEALGGEHMRIVSNSLATKKMLAGRHEVYLLEDEELLEWHDPDEFGLAIVDIDKTHGVYASRAIRDENSNLPIIGISESLPNDSDWFGQRAMFIEQGGTYLLQAPVNPRELLACIMEIGRRFGSIRPMMLLAGRQLAVNLSQRVVMFNGRRLPFTGKENMLFMELADHFEKVRTKENLMSAIYRLEEDEAEIKIVDVFICKVRKKLDEMHPGLGKCIETIWGQGYKLVDLPQEVSTD